MMYRTIHSLALAMIIILLLMNVASHRNFNSLPLSQHIFQFIVGIAIWSLFLYKIWKKPRNWGLGLGILFFLMIPFQTYLWHIAVTTHDTSPRNPNVLIFLLYETPLLIAAICCVLLRFIAPISYKTAEQGAAANP
jgi:hypothetical protein